MSSPAQIIDPIAYCSFITGVIITLVVLVCLITYDYGLELSFCTTQS